MQFHICITQSKSASWSVNGEMMENEYPTLDSVHWVEDLFSFRYGLNRLWGRTTRPAAVAKKEAWNSLEASRKHHQFQYYTQHADDLSYLIYSLWSWLCVHEMQTGFSRFIQVYTEWDDGGTKSKNNGKRCWIVFFFLSYSIPPLPTRLPDKSSEKHHFPTSNSFLSSLFSYWKCLSSSVAVQCILWCNNR